MSSAVPEGWELSPLSSLADYKNGRAFKPSDWSKSGLPILRIAQINNPHKVEDYYDGNDINDGHFITKGDLIFSWSATLKAEIWSHYDAVLNQHIFKVTEKVGTNRSYLQQLLDYAIPKLAESSHGSTMKHIKKGVLDEFFSPVPPLLEQKKIASILTSVDEVIENTQKQIDKLQDLKKATMNELLTKGIGHTEFKDSELGRIPASWGVVSLDKVCKVRQGLQIPIRDRLKGAATGRYPYLTVSWINSKFDIDKAEFIANPNDSVVLKSNEFVVGRTGAVGQIFDGLECVFHNNFFAVSLLSDSVEKEFLKHFLKWHTTQDLLLKLAGSTTIPDLNHGDFYSINVGLPPVEEQCRVVSQVDSIDTTLREIRLKLNALMSLKKSLMQDLLTGKVRVTVN
jgi:type I restriction enzyme, S subunit